MGSQRMTATDRRLLRWKPVETKAQRLERVARQMREEGLTADEQLQTQAALAYLDRPAEPTPQELVRIATRVALAAAEEGLRVQQAILGALRDAGTVRRIDAGPVDLPVAQSDGNA